MLKRSDNHDLSAQNTFRMKVSCACYIEYDSVEDLKSLDFDSLPKPLLSIGEGSNLLFTGDFEGTVLRSRIDYVKYFDVGADTVPLAVGSGVKWDDLVAKTCADGLWGMENLSLIPGTVGAAAVQNIGAYGVEVKDIIAGETCFDLRTREKTSDRAGNAAAPSTPLPILRALSTVPALPGLRVNPMVNPAFFYIFIFAMYHFI